MKASDILNLKGVLLFTIQPELSLQEAIDIMHQNDVGSLVVLEQGRFVGMLTFREMMRAISQYKARYSSFKVRDVMNVNVPIATLDDEVKPLSVLMVEKHCRYMPVFDKDVLMGVISLYDIAKAILDEQEQENTMLRAYIHDGSAVTMS